MTTLIIPTDRTRSMDLLARRLGELCERWQPHPKQVAFLAALMTGKYREFVLEWGRRSGKSEVMVAAAALWGQLVTSSQSYYFAPQLNQGAEILWKNQKIQAVVPPNWIDDMLDGEMRAFWAGSPHRSCWFKVDGADYYDRRRGIEPRRGLLFVDEAREVLQQFWAVIEPTLARFESPVIFSSTPPDSLMDEDNPEQPHWVIRLFDAIAKRGFYSHATSYDNPHLSVRFLDQKRAELEERGEGDVFDREYLAKRVPKRTGRKFPMVNADRHRQPHVSLLNECGYRRNFEYLAITDPAGAGGKKSVWAWNFIARHIYTQKLYVLDELDTENQGEMSTGKQWPEAIKKVEAITGLSTQDDWEWAYDDAETWFHNEVLERYEFVIHPANKGRRSKTEGYSMIKDLLLADMLVISDRCIRTWWELENYEGEKSRDHHVDLLRYALTVFGYDPNEKPEPKPEKKSVLYYGVGVNSEKERDAEKRVLRDWTEGLV
jgi:hypothetical protein